MLSCCGCGTVVMSGKEREEGSAFIHKIRGSQFNERPTSRSTETEQTRRKYCDAADI